MSINKTINSYFKIKEKLSKELSSLDNLDKDELSLDALTELLKDISFESKVFELALKIHPIVAEEHLKKYYFSDTPSNLSRFKGNLDIMLDDYKLIVGKAALDDLIKEIPVNFLDFPVIKDAIDFANDE